MGFFPTVNLKILDRTSESGTSFSHIKKRIKKKIIKNIFMRLLNYTSLNLFSLDIKFQKILLTK